MRQFAINPLNARADDNFTIPVRRDGFGAIENQVHHELVELTCIAIDTRKVILQMQPHAGSAWHGSLDQAIDVSDHLRDVKVARQGGALASVRQELPCELGSTFAGAHHVFDQPAHGIGFRHSLQRQAGISNDADEQIIEIVCDSTRNQPEALQRLGPSHSLSNSLAVGYVLDINQQTLGRLRIRSDVVPAPTAFTEDLGQYRDALRHGAAQIVLQGGTERFRKLFPQGGTEQLFALGVQHAFSLNVQVTESKFRV